MSGVLHTLAVAAIGVIIVAAFALRGRRRRPAAPTPASPEELIAAARTPEELAAAQLRAFAEQLLGSPPRP